MAEINEHSLREALVMELHARPFENLSPPLKVSHLALFTGVHGADDDRRHLARLCAEFGGAAPPEGGKFHSTGCDGLRMRWERHTEFSTYTFIKEGPFAHPFEEIVIDAVPGDWLANLPGQVIAATHLALESDDEPERDRETLAKLFDGNTFVGCDVADGSGAAWSDLRIHGDRFARILMRDRSMTGRQAGRHVQRLLEINTYRLMALLALPEARATGPKIFDLDQRVAEIASSMTRERGAQPDADLLERLTTSAAEIEDMVAATSERFSAATAYFALVHQRLSEIREKRIEGLQTFSEFLGRHLTPAMRTCESTAERLAALSSRSARLASLLRARVDVSLQEQNQQLLQSMDRRARLQLRLQETVEGLSVVAISYYMVGLVRYGFKALKSSGVGLDIDVATGLAIPFVLGLVWFGLRRMRRRLLKDSAAAE